MNYLVPSIILLLTVVLYDHFNTISENLTNNSIPSCSCIYDIDSTLTTGESGKDIEIAIDSRASAESCIRAGCAIGVATGGTHCTEKDPEGCNITKYALGFNILNDDEVNNASKQIGLPIVTGKDWVIANWNKPNAMQTLSKKISKPSCGILIDDNILQSCGQCNAYTSDKGCPAPWGSTKSDLENPNLDLVKKAYSCSFTNTNNLPGTDYTWVPARPINVDTPNHPGKAQMGGTGMEWQNGAQTAPAVGLSNEIWNQSIQTDIIQNLGGRCNAKFQSVTNPVLKSWIPPKDQCDWANSPPKCSNDDDCSKWATTNCKGKTFVESYCKDNGYCHFKI